MARIYAFAAPVDLRLGYSGLYGLVVNRLGRDPMDGDAFLFVNRRRTSAKVLRHDGTGLTIFMKRLDRGRFAALRARSDGLEVRLSKAELQLFLEGDQQLSYISLSPRAALT